MSGKEFQLSYTLWHEWFNEPIRSAKPMAMVRMETPDGLFTAWEFEVMEVAPPPADGRGPASLQISMLNEGFATLHDFAPFLARGVQLNGNWR
ncbi:hypothetical protein [Nocardia sp. NPDC046763]|uniref:hypothetical protein n=1 Tax=Nocardia sp. NPDC046763 TaxID=3155256 RepID=UPI0034068B74